MKMTTIERVEKMMRDLGNLDQPAFGSLAGASKSVVNQWLSGKIKSIAAEYAFRLQRKTGFNAEWIQLGEGAERVGEVIEAEPKHPAPTGFIEFGLLDVAAAAGDGASTVEFPQTIQPIWVLESWARERFNGTAYGNVKLITARGTSMQGTIENGDVLFVDASVRDYDGEGIYVIARGQDVQVKRLQKLHGNRLAVISDNPHNRSEELTPDEADEIIICGRVLASWTLKRFW